MLRIISFGISVLDTLPVSEPFPFQKQRFSCLKGNCCLKQQFILLLMSLFLITGLPLSGECQTLTLENCLAIAHEQNPALLASGYQLASAEEDVKVAKSDFFPKISISSDYTHLDNIDASGTADVDYITQDRLNFAAAISQTLYAGNRILNAYQRAQANALRVEADRSYKTLQLAYRVKVIFFQLMKAKEDVVVAEDTVKRLAADVATTEAFYDNELTPYAQVLQARVDLADARQRQSIAKNEVERKRAELFEQLNMPFDPAVRFSGGLTDAVDPIHLTPEVCIERAAQQRFDLKSLLYQVEMMEKDASASVATYLPMVKLNAGLYDQDKKYDEALSDQHNTYWSAGLNVSWNLFDGKRGWHQKEKYLIEIKRIRSLYNEIESQIVTGIRRALFSLSESEERIATSSEAMAAAEEYHDRESKRFQAGIATIASVLDAQVRLTRAKGNIAQAQLDYQLARAELDFIMGETQEKGD